jgi:hypothetical protein
MPLTRDQIAQTADRYGLEVLEFQPGPGTRADIVLKDGQSGGSVTIGLWPCSTEEDLTRSLSMALSELQLFHGPGVARSLSWLS